MLSAKWVELINKNKFVKAALIKASETFTVFVAALEIVISIVTVYFLRVLLLTVLK